MLLIGRPSAVHPLQRDLSLDQATEQDELRVHISGVGIECIVTATGFKQKGGYTSMESETGNIIMIFADCHHSFSDSSHRRSLTVPVTAIFSIPGERELGHNIQDTTEGARKGTNWGY